MANETKQSIADRNQELEAELNKLRKELYEMRLGKVPVPDPYAQAVVSARALRKFVHEELPNLFNDGNDVGLVPTGLVAFVVYQTGQVYSHAAGAIEFARVHGVAQHFLAAHVAKQINDALGNVGAYRDPELRRRLERGY